MIAALHAVLEAQASGAAQGSEFELVSNARPSPKATGSQVLSSAGVSGERREIARGMGRWLERCVAGEIRGPSGRDRINVPSKLYIAVRGIHLKAHSSPLSAFSLGRKPRASVVRGRTS